jgi:hypothetical protein
MSRFVLYMCLTTALLMPKVGNAQVFSVPTPSPGVSAVNTDWYARGEPIFFAGNFYFPTGPTVFFDGKIMVRSGMYNAVPLYTDTTIEPYSMVFVPIGGNVVRPYERRRDGELTGTVGSRPPSFPIQRDGDLSVRTPGGGIITPPVPQYEPEVIAEAGRAVGTSSMVVPRPAPSIGIVGASRPSPTANPMSNPAAHTPAPQYTPRPTGNDGVWIEYDGTRWFSAGKSVAYDPDRFEPIGSHRGFVVYRDKMGSADTVFVSVTPGGPVAPYKRR